MKWSWKLGEVAGIGVYMHATFLILIVWVAFAYWMQNQSVLFMLSGIAFILTLFGCVLLHELGHALTAKKFGIKTRDITLLPIGGLARLERMPDNPIEELWVAIAGPAVNVVIAGILFVILFTTQSLSNLQDISVTTGSFLGRLMVVNIFLVVFNMLPAFPMDGGRVVRALLALKMDYVRATQIAASLGQMMAFLFGFIGLFYNPFLVFIAFFVYIGAAQEASMVQMKSAFSGIPVSKAMVTEFHILSPNDTLEKVIELILSGTQHDYPVVENGNILGVLTKDKLIQQLPLKGRQATVGEIMDKDFKTAEASEMLERAFTRLQTCDCHTIPVTRSGELVGLLTMDNVGEFVMIQSALDERKRKKEKQNYI